MKNQLALNLLIPLIFILALISAGAGLFVQGGDGSFPFTTLRGQTVTIYGLGLYHNDTLFTGAGFRGTDAALILIGLPLLMAVYLSYRRGSTTATLIMIGLLFYY